ncbi:MAG: cyclic peptide export ABC transporter [Sphingobacterium sp.]|jgi:putative ATP-binding cassette transporter|uniref:cyclic peptide export ABC transporter n=1 Tax=Sphingobacterium sp. TaxID=341027 RepID=UPI002846070E|nr:cyclic peptide export ABC transporter [Sphingobacterium sp.]MDR3010881.1 cyclic peptide export ABC transporter [Sphingobacterium sp.]
MKNLTNLLKAYLGIRKIAVNVIYGICSGLFSFLFIHIINKLIGTYIEGRQSSINSGYFIILTFIIIMTVWLRRKLSLSIIHSSQQLIWNLRNHIIRLVLRSEHQTIRKKKSNLYSSVVGDVNTINQATLGIIDFSTSIVLAFACLFYLANISIVLFLISTIVLLIGIFIYHISSTRNMHDFKIARKLENDFLKNFSHLLDGFKEIFLDKNKGDYIYHEQIDVISKKSFQTNIVAFTGFLNNQIIGQILFNLLICSILLFIGPKLNVTSKDLVSFILTLLFLLNSVTTIMVILPSIMRAEVASQNLNNLQHELEGRLGIPILKTKIDSFIFDTLKIENLCYNSVSKEGSFCLGPINFEIKKGEIVFIHGGNGSGKTTLIHTILGLQFPSSGKVILNGQVVILEDYNNYRSYFSAVFSDFYLFDQMIGFTEYQIKEWNYYCELFELTNKVSLSGNHYSTLDLSTGQRKRLALISAILENKPIIVLDEWAADQDPYFRKKFYIEILPLLKDKGFTIIAITHDDNYFNFSDRLFKMDFGKLIEVKHSALC